MKINQDHDIIIYRFNSDRVLADEIDYLRDNEQLYISLGIIYIIFIHSISIKGEEFNEK